MSKHGPTLSKCMAYQPYEYSLVTSHDFYPMKLHVLLQVHKETTTSAITVLDALAGLNPALTELSSSADRHKDTQNKYCNPR